MNSTLEEVSTSLYAGCVPVSWCKLSPQTFKSLARFMEHLEKRTLQYESWVNKNIIMRASNNNNSKICKNVRIKINIL